MTFVYLKKFFDNDVLNLLHRIAFVFAGSGSVLNDRGGRRITDQNMELCVLCLLDCASS